MKLTQSAKLYAPAILACLLWSSAFAVIKIGLAYTTPLFFAGLRFTLAGIILIPFVGNFRNAGHILKEQWRTVSLLGFIQIAILYTFFYLGLSRVSASTGAIITGSSPLVAAVTAHFFFHEDKLNYRKVLAILIGILGIVVVTLGRQGTLTLPESKEGLGILFLFAGTLSSALGNVVVVKKRRKIGPVLLTSGQLIIGGTLMLLLAAFTEEVPPLTLALPFWASLLWLTFISATAFSLWFFNLQQPQAVVSDQNVWKFILPVSGAIISWVILPNDTPNPLQIAGMTLVGLSILFYYKKSSN